MMAAMSAGFVSRSRQGECSRGAMTSVLLIDIAIQVKRGFFKENSFSGDF
jgi:hypothetical protein